MVPPGVDAAGPPESSDAVPAPSQPGTSADPDDRGARDLVLRPGFVLGDTSLVLYFDVGGEDPAGEGVPEWSSWFATVFDPEGAAQQSISMAPDDLGICGAPRRYCHSFGSEDGWTLEDGEDYFVTVTATLPDGSEVTSDPSDEDRARETIVPPEVATPQAVSCGCPTALAYSAPTQAIRGAGVRTGTGAFHWANLDLRMASFAVPFRAARTYSSANVTAGSLGRGWAWTYDVRVIPPAGNDASVTVRAEDGAQVTYQGNEDGSYARPSGVRSDLTRAEDGSWRLTTPAQVRYTFDDSGRLTAIRNPRGYGVGIEYAGNSWTITDAADRQVKVKLTDEGLVRQVHLPDERRIKYDYTDGLLTTVTDANNKRWKYTYNDDGLLTEVIDPRGRVQVANSYADRRVVSQTDATGAITTFEWDAEGQEAKTTDPDGVVVYDGYRGNVLVYSQNGNGDVDNTRYDRSLNANLTVDPKGNQYEGEFDPAGNRTSLLAPEPFSFTEEQQYDVDNNLTSFTDGEGNSGAYAYTSDHELEQATDRNGDQTSYERDERGLITSITDPLGNVTRFTYDDDGNRVSRESPAGATTTYTYDKVGRMTSRTDPRGNEPGAKPDRFTTRYSYDRFDRLHTVRSPGKRRAVSVYDDFGQLAATIDPLGRKTSYSYDEVIGRLVAVTEPEHRTTRFGFSEAGRRTSVKDPEGNLTTFSYDDRGFLSAVVSPRGNEPDADKEAFTTRYIYDFNGNLVRTTRAFPGGGTSQVDADFDELDRPRSITDPLGNRTIATQDNTNNVISSVDPLGQETRISYDAVGRPRAVTAPGDAVAEAEYDAAGNVVRRTSPTGGVATWTYDADGRPVTMTEPRGNVPGADPAEFTTHYEYDAAGNLVEVVDPLGGTETFDYDRNNRLASQTDRNGNVTRYRYDDADQVTAVAGPDAGKHSGHWPPTSRITRYDYHDDGTVASRTDPNGHRTRFSYDKLGQLTSVTDPLDRTRKFGYDAEGNLTTIRTAGHGDVADRTITDTYDPLNRRVRREVATDGPVYTFGYDANDRLTAVGDPTGLQERSYDEKGRLTRVSRGDEVFQYAYDAIGNVVQRDWPDGTRVTAAYDAGNRLTELTTVGGVAGSAPSTTSFDYDASDRLVTTTHPEAAGLTTDRAYDRAGRLVELATHPSAGGDPLARYQLSRDPVGNPTRIVTVRGEASETAAYRYDRADRITAACYGVDAEAQRHDGDCPESASGSVQYRYDLVGNRLSESRSGTMGEGRTKYTYDAADQLQVAERAGHPFSRRTFDYDREGNLTRSGSSRYTYHLDHTLASATVDDRTTTFDYDGTGLRISAAPEDGAPRSWAWDVTGDTPWLALETTADGQRGFLPAPDHGPLAMLSDGGSQTYVPDWLNGVAGVVSPSGEVVEQYDYDPYGNPRDNGTAEAGEAEPASPLRFAGMYADPALDGQYALPLRVYDPTTGRFGGVDPVPASTREPVTSTYAYVLDRPTVLLDPTGGRPIADGGGGGLPPPPTDSSSPPSGSGSDGDDRADWDKYPWELPCTSSPAQYCRILLYIHDELVRNSQSETVDQIKGLLEYHRDPGFWARVFNPRGVNDALISALSMWTAKVCQRLCEWDHKPKIRDKFGMSLSDQDSLYSDVPGTKYRVFYDVWSNIHYGYVGRVATFTEQTLQEGAGSGNPLAGTNDPGDVITVQIGIDLAGRVSPGELSPDNIDYALRARLAELYSLFVSDPEIKTVLLRKD